MTTRLYRLFLVGALTTTGSTLFAQEAGISGRIFDSSHLIISGGIVSVTDQESHQKRAARSNDSGLYSLPGLRPGTYDLIVSADGFGSQERRSVALEVGQQSRITFTLKPGNTSQVVTISGDSDVRETGDGSVSMVVDRQLTDDMPLNGRSFQSLVTLAPGVNLSNAQNSNGQFVVGGVRASANSFSVDGVNTAGTVTGYQSAGGNNGGYNAAGGTNSMVSVDALQEFRVLTSSYAAEYGRTPGAHILLVTRSGTNSHHGSAFEYYRNDKLDAADWFVNRAGQSRPPLRLNDFGGVLGGPVVRNKTFYFVSWEGQRLVEPQFAVTTVPSLAARAKAAPVVLPFMDAFPLPNGPTLDDSHAVFSAGYSNPLSTDSTLIKVDQSLTPSTRAFGTFTWAPSGRTNRSNSGSTSLADSEVTRFSTKSLTVGLTYFFKTAFITDARMNLSTSSNTSHYTMDNFGGATVPANDLLLPGTSADHNYSFVSLGDSNGDLLGGDLGTLEQRQINFVDDTTYVFGTHQLKFGGDYRKLLPLLTAAGDQYFHFDGVTGLAKNQLDAFHSTAPSRARPQMTNVSLYAQDTWRGSSRLTVTFGVRWDFNSVPRDRDANNGNLVPLLGNYAASKVAVGVPGTALWKPQYANFAPRLGVAWRLRQHRGWETTFRFGGGLFYDTGIAEASAQPWVSGYPAGQGTVLLNSSLPVSSTQVRLPALNLAQPPPGNHFFMFPSDFEAPRIWEWNVALEQTLGRDQELTVTLAGSSGRKLLYAVTYPIVTENIWTVTFTDNSGRSDYNALQIQYQRRLSHGLAAAVGYTWSHSIDTNSSDTSTYVPTVFEPSSSNRGDSDFDIRHSFHGGFSYSIPGVAGPFWLKALSGGWGLDGIVSAQTALPIGVTARRSIGFGTYAFRPNLVPGIPVWIINPHVAGARQINPAAFIAPAGNVQGDLGRNSLRGFDLVQADLSIRRYFPLGDRLSLMFRADMFNALNHPNFANPLASLESGLFGMSTASVANSQVGGGAFGLNSVFNTGGPRAMQISLKLRF